MSSRSNATVGSTTDADGASTPRRPRYSRTSTASVTQLLTDSCSSLLNRLTRRGPSEKRLPDTSLSAARTRFDDRRYGAHDSVLSSVKRYDADRRHSPYGSSYTTERSRHDRPYLSYIGPSNTVLNGSPVRLNSSSSKGVGDSLGRVTSLRARNIPNETKVNSPVLGIKRIPLRETNNNVDSSSELGSTRSRLEDKYSSVLDRIANRKKEEAKREKEDRDKTLEPAVVPRNLVRSFTTTVFGEKSFATGQGRDKTPFRSTTERRLSNREKKSKNRVEEDGDSSGDQRRIAGKDRNSVYRRHMRRSLRVGKSETNERKLAKLSICPSDTLEESARDLVSPTTAAARSPATPPSTTFAKSSDRALARRFFCDEEDDDKTPTADPAVAERETRRKEIQSLIMKYAALDEVYGRLGEPKPAAQPEPAPTRADLCVGDLAPVALPSEARGKHRPLRPRHLTRRAATPPVSRMKLRRGAKISAK